MACSHTQNLSFNFCMQKDKGLPSVNPHQERFRTQRGGRSLEALWEGERKYPACPFLSPSGEDEASPLWLEVVESISSALGWAGDWQGPAAAFPFCLKLDPVLLSASAGVEPQGQRWLWWGRGMWKCSPWPSCWSQWHPSCWTTLTRWPPPPGTPDSSWCSSQSTSRSSSSTPGDPAAATRAFQSWGVPSGSTRDSTQLCNLSWPHTMPWSQKTATGGGWSCKERKLQRAWMPLWQSCLGWSLGTGILCRSAAPTPAGAAPSWATQATCCSPGMATTSTPTTSCSEWTVPPLLATNQMLGARPLTTLFILRATESWQQMWAWSWSPSKPWICAGSSPLSPQAPSISLMFQFQGKSKSKKKRSWFIIQFLWNTSMKTGWSIMGDTPPQAFCLWCLLSMSVMRWVCMALEQTAKDTGTITGRTTLQVGLSGRPASMTGILSSI